MMLKSNKKLYADWKDQFFFIGRYFMSKVVELISVAVRKFYGQWVKSGLRTLFVKTLPIRSLLTSIK